MTTHGCGARTKCKTNNKLSTVLCIPYGATVASSMACCLGSPPFSRGSSCSREFKRTEESPATEKSPLAFRDDFLSEYKEAKLRKRLRMKRRKFHSGFPSLLGYKTSSVIIFRNPFSIFFYKNASCCFFLLTIFSVRKPMPLFF